MKEQATSSKPKLNIKTTIFVSLALLIWYVYLQIINNTVQVVVVQTLGHSETIKGVILLITNLLPLFLIPLFARMSDNTIVKEERKNSSLIQKVFRGRRMPFIVIGTLITSALLIASILFARFGSGSSAIWGYGILFSLSAVGISVYRPSAMALLPDVTPKPFRENANSICNIVSGLGSLVVIITIAIFGESKSGMLWVYIFSVGSLIVFMFVSLLSINETKLVKQCAIETKALDIEEPEVEEDLKVKTKFSTYYKAMEKGKKKSLTLLILAVALQNIGGGAILMTYLTFMVNVWGISTNIGTVAMVIIGIGGFLAAPLIAKFSPKFGRKKVLLGGVVILAIGLIIGFLCNHVAFMNNYFFYVLTFAVFGFGWFVCTVVPFPMILEFSDVKNNGTFTSMFTVATFAPRAFTGLLAGVFIDSLGYNALFPYAFVFVAISFLVLLGVKHGELKIKESEASSVIKE